jgi:prolyl-tRNA editing enzyme YbaK/EbsC (Cys-tRNA(Pro) deacylase)
VVLKLIRSGTTWKQACELAFAPQSQLILFQGLAKEQSSREEQCNLHLQAKHVEYLGDAVSKNLFLKDKKDRLYLITALASTTVDIKKIALRLGVGKSGIRFAPEETLQAGAADEFLESLLRPKRRPL